MIEGRVPAASDEELEHAGRVLRCSDGTFHFEPQELEADQGITLPLTAYAEAALSWAERKRASFSSELDLERLVAGDLIDFSRPATSRADFPAGASFRCRLELCREISSKLGLVIDNWLDGPHIL